MLPDRGKKIIQAVQITQVAMLDANVFTIQSQKWSISTVPDPKEDRQEGLAIISTPILGLFYGITSLSPEDLLLWIPKEG